MDSSHDGRQHLGRFLENNDGSTIASGTAAAAVDYLVAFGEGQSNSRNGGRSITGNPVVVVNSKYSCLTQWTSNPFRVKTEGFETFQNV